VDGGVKTKSKTNCLYGLVFFDVGPKVSVKFLATVECAIGGSEVEALGWQWDFSSILCDR
jgi:hypothetical protein